MGCGLLESAPGVLLQAVACLNPVFKTVARHKVKSWYEILRKYAGGAMVHTYHTYMVLPGYVRYWMLGCTGIRMEVVA